MLYILSQYLYYQIIENYALLCRSLRRGEGCWSLRCFAKMGGPGGWSNFFDISFSFDMIWYERIEKVKLERILGNVKRKDICPPHYIYIILTLVSDLHFLYDVQRFIAIIKVNNNIYFPACSFSYLSTSQLCMYNHRMKLQLLNLSILHWNCFKFCLLKITF